MEKTGTAGLLWWATMGSEALDVLYDLRWMLVLIVVLIVSDFWFGVSDALNKHKEFRFSRAGRRTCNITLLTCCLVLSLGSPFLNRLV